LLDKSKFQSELIPPLYKFGYLVVLNVDEIKFDIIGVVGWRGNLVSSNVLLYAYICPMNDLEVQET